MPEWSLLALVERLGRWESFAQGSTLRAETVTPKAPRDTTSEGNWVGIPLLPGPAVRQPSLLTARLNIRQTAGSGGNKDTRF